MAKIVVESNQPVNLVIIHHDAQDTIVVSTLAFQDRGLRLNPVMTVLHQISSQNQIVQVTYDINSFVSVTSEHSRDRKRR